MILLCVLMLPMLWIMVVMMDVSIFLLSTLQPVGALLVSLIHICVPILVTAASTAASTAALTTAAVVDVVEKGLSEYTARDGVDG